MICRENYNLSREWLQSQNLNTSYQAKQAKAAEDDAEIHLNNMFDLKSKTQIKLLL